MGDNDASALSIASQHLAPASAVLPPTREIKHRELLDQINAHHNPNEPPPDRPCDGCDVREPHQHRCHGLPCPCEECREADRLFDTPPDTRSEVETLTLGDALYMLRDSHGLTLVECDGLAERLTPWLAKHDAQVWAAGWKRRGEVGIAETGEFENPYRADRIEADRG